ncbi:hypothetical protein [Legionella pneumophila]|uniref:Uncharacterized protein n=1 Tax=Legionella pneumophila subsp. pascullei TaxID=91890 RepID=A0AAX2IZF5_LEGPN|nr:hypothetical protein [Legionella pneumophila]SQG91730.1 Uncharacterised protein [Legionella pneumophila subsp. pascullei]VEH08276.1 Uncharacterised protein [Legionella pneumophila subsp. pascullei]HDU8261751.1 hypothetical protein [Legionella pneumophila]
MQKIFINQFHEKIIAGIHIRLGYNEHTKDKPGCLNDKTNHPAFAFLFFQC